ncbi:MAG: glucose-1-phosphate adenylyltransferase [Pirellulales bacterium]|jgi:glucose-1-phosphate adenylyltransferase
MKNIISLVLGGGQGSRLYPLTKYRSKPAVPLAGKYRLIDIPLSNCINSGLNRIYVLTQFLSVSLHRHMRQTYRFDNFSGGFVELLAAQQTADQGTDWYQGTADAVRKNLKYIKQSRCEHVLILSGDQLYRMDYAEMLKTHVDSGAEATIGGMPVHGSEASGLGVMRLDETGRVVGFVEKPQTEDELNLVRMDPAWIDSRGIESKGRDCIASMGIYLFNRETLIEVLEKTDYQDFGKEIFPAAIRAKHVQMHLFDGYWEDIGTVRAFYESALSLAGPNPPFKFVEESNPIYTRARFLPPTSLGNVTIKRSQLADGCSIGDGCTIDNSTIGLRSLIEENVTIKDSVLMGADYYETSDDVSEDKSKGRPELMIGAGSVIQGAIIDKNCHIGKNVKIVNTSGIVDKEYEIGITIVDGIPVVEKGAIVPDNFVLD